MISINIPIKTKKSKSKPVKLNPLDGYIELKPWCIKYFHGCWLKCIKKPNKEYNSGGFLVKIEHGFVFLRVIQNPELIKFCINEYTFFSKKDSENYISMQEIELDKEKLKREYKKLNQEIIKNKKKEIRILKFEKIREKFFKLCTEGKVKILK